MDNVMTVKSDEARTRFRELLDHAERGGDVRILRYNRPVATMTIADPNPLDDRLLAMAAIIREEGDDHIASEIETGAVFIREALRGSDDSDWQPAKDAARKIAFAEDRAIFHGYPAANILDGRRQRSRRISIGGSRSPLRRRHTTGPWRRKRRWRRGSIRAAARSLSITTSNSLVCSESGVNWAASRASSIF